MIEDEEDIKPRVFEKSYKQINKFRNTKVESINM
jgi:hypothetical protein